MYLKRLEIQGFKSFANKTVLEFGEGITAVVGPNGSGKSNISDSIRWVLGEQSAKQLRGKKSEDVIFAGSEKKARLSFAEVSVTFDNEDRKIPIDYSEVSITRRMDRSGESDYLINGNKVRLLDVIDLILKSNIGTSRYTVIGQGTIDQMILSGPAELKNLLDEASGVKTYYLRRDKALKRLEQTAQNLMRVKDLLVEIEPRLKSLRRQAKRMQERAVIEQELKTYQSEFFAGKLKQLQAAVAEFDTQINVIEEHRKGLEEKMLAQRSMLDKSEESNRSEIQEYQAIQNEIKKLTDQKNKVLEDQALIRGKLQAQKTVGTGDAKSLDLEKRDLEAAKQNFIEEIAKAKEQQAGIEAQLRDKRQAFQAVAEQLEAVQKTLENPEQIDFSELSQNLNDLDRSFSEFYTGLQTTGVEQGMNAILPLAESFRNSFDRFKERTTAFVRNPFENFEKQRKAFQEILGQKDRMNQELSHLDLERSKIAINHDYLNKELQKAEQKLLQVNLEIQSVSATDIDAYFNQLLEQEQKCIAEVGRIASLISDLENKIAKYHSAEQARKREMLDEERLYRQNQDQLSKLKDRESALQIEKAKIDTQKENLMAEAHAALGESAMEVLNNVAASSEQSRTENLESRIQKLKHQLEMIGGIDDLTLQEYNETEQRYTYLSSQVQDLEKAMDDLRAIIEELDGHIKKQFSEAFAKIDEHFQNYFRVLFNGGRAYLSLLRQAKEDAQEQAIDEVESGEADESAAEKAMDSSLRPEEKIVAKYENGADNIIGIDIKATPPGKKLSTISALSGGEQALTSIALLCSLLTCFPSPFVVLDEVDAALDEANTIRFAQIVSNLSDKTQFITVSHNRETMRQANILYGVTMGDDSISKILSIKLDQAQAYAK